jgi:hypothetical protein
MARGAPMKARTRTLRAITFRCAAAPCILLGGSARVLPLGSDVDPRRDPDFYGAPNDDDVVVAYASRNGYARAVHVAWSRADRVGAGEFALVELQAFLAGDAGAVVNLVIAQRVG